MCHLKIVIRWGVKGFQGFEETRKHLENWHFALLCLANRLVGHPKIVIIRGKGIPGSWGEKKTFGNLAWGFATKSPLVVGRLTISFIALSLDSTLSKPVDGSAQNYQYDYLLCSLVWLVPGPCAVFGKLMSHVGKLSPTNSLISLQAVPCIFCQGIVSTKVSPVTIWWGGCKQTKDNDFLIILASKLCTRTDRALAELISAVIKNLSCFTWSLPKLVINKFQAACNEFLRALFTVDCAAMSCSSCWRPLASCTKTNFLKSKSGSRPFLGVQKLRCHLTPSDAINQKNVGFATLKKICQEMHEDHLHTQLVVQSPGRTWRWLWVMNFNQNWLYMGEHLQPEWPADRQHDKLQLLQ